MQLVRRPGFPGCAFELAGFGIALPGVYRKRPEVGWLNAASLTILGMHCLTALE